MSPLNLNLKSKKPLGVLPSECSVFYLSNHLKYMGILDPKLTYWDWFAYVWGGQELLLGAHELTSWEGENSYLLGVVLKVLCRG